MLQSYISKVRRIVGGFVGPWETKEVERMFYARYSVAGAANCILSDRRSK